MRANAMLDRRRCTLLVIDMQERLRRHIDEFDAVVGNASVLVRACRRMAVPVMVTEQHPVRLGSTVAELTADLAGAQTLVKTHFSAARAAGFDLAGRDQVLVCGIEAHLCVSQTVQDLVAAGLDVQVAADAVSSRTDAHRQLGLARAQVAGAVLTGAEAAVFELLERAGTEEFRHVLGLLKQLQPEPLSIPYQSVSPLAPSIDEKRRRRQLTLHQPQTVAAQDPQPEGVEMEYLRTVADPTDSHTRFIVHLSDTRSQWYRVREDQHEPLVNVGESVAALGIAAHDDQWFMQPGRRRDVG